MSLHLCASLILGARDIVASKRGWFPPLWRSHSVGESDIKHIISPMATQLRTEVREFSRKRTWFKNQTAASWGQDGSVERWGEEVGLQDGGPSRGHRSGQGRVWQETGRRWRGVVMQVLWAGKGLLSPGHPRAPSPSLAPSAAHSTALRWPSRFVPGRRSLQVVLSPPFLTPIHKHIIKCLW